MLSHSLEDIGTECGILYLLSLELEKVRFGARCTAQHTEGQALRSRWHRSKVNKVRIWHNLDVTFADFVQDLNRFTIRGVRKQTSMTYV